MKKIKILLLTIFFIVNVPSFGQSTYVGIPSGVFNFCAAAQNNSNWCWAASMEMVFRYYGIGIQQSQIVARSYGVDPYGRLPNWTGSFEVITRNLNNWSIDNNGRMYSVASQLNWGAPTPAYLVQELTAQRPVLVGYQSSPTTGHAVVITACSYVPTPNGPMIQSIVVRDPWPNPQNIQNMGRVEYSGSDFASRITAHWYIRIY